MGGARVNSSSKGPSGAGGAGGGSQISGKRCSAGIAGDGGVWRGFVALERVDLGEGRCCGGYRVEDCE